MLIIVGVRTDKEIMMVLPLGIAWLVINVKVLEVVVGDPLRVTLVTLTVKGVAETCNRVTLVGN